MSGRRRAADRAARVYVYVVKYDFGFAPNPFDGMCTLACCMPVIRRVARSGDWVVGVGGRDLKATGRCIFAMEVSGALTFEEYWADEAFASKRPSRNGTRKSLVGDNIYHRDGDGRWMQEDSVHSREDGRMDEANTEHDTSVNRVLVSSHFVYFGRVAPAVPPSILADLRYKNGRGHRVFEATECTGLLGWVVEQAGGPMNRVLGTPFQFHLGHRRFSRTRNRLI